MAFNWPQHPKYIRETTEGVTGEVDILAPEDTKRGDFRILAEYINILDPVTFRGFQ